MEHVNPDGKDVKDDKPAPIALVHVYAQAQYHDDCYVVGNIEGLTRLRDAIDKAIGAKRIVVKCGNKERAVTDIRIDNDSIGCSLVNGGTDDLFDQGFTHGELVANGLHVSNGAPTPALKANAEVMASDGEGYEIKVRLDDSDWQGVDWRKLALPYEDRETTGITQAVEAGALWPYQRETEYLDHIARQEEES